MASNLKAPTHASFSVDPVARFSWKNSSRSAREARYVGGRVSSMTMLSDYTLLPLATPFFGWLAATTSVTTTAALFGAGMALAGLWGASRPAIRAVLRPSVRSGTMEV